MNAHTPISRRGFLSAAAIGAGMLVPAVARAQTLPADLRGSMDATRLGVRPGALDNQSIALQNAINSAAREGQPLFLPAGDFLVSNIDLPSGTTLIGVPGRTRIRYAGDGHLMFATQVENIHLEGLVLDGGNRTLADYTPALLHISTGTAVALDNCAILGSRKTAITLDRVSGRIDRCTLSGSREAGLVSNDARGLAIRDSVIADCGDYGVLVRRWTAGRDATLITGNRIERVRALSGDDGQFGHAIKLWGAGDVRVAGNTIHDADFGAICASGASHAQITGNSCTQLGGIAISAQDDFQGAVIASNIIEAATGGIALSNFLEGGRLASVQGNMVRNIAPPARTRTSPDDPSYGVGIRVEADTSVTGNVVEGASVAGIRVGWGPYLRNVIVSQNIIRRAAMGIAVSVVDGVGGSLISDNMMDDTPEGAVVGMRWWEPVTGDLTRQDNPPATLTLQGNQNLS